MRLTITVVAATIACASVMHGQRAIVGQVPTGPVELPRPDAQVRLPPKETPIHTGRDTDEQALATQVAALSDVEKRRLAQQLADWGFDLDKEIARLTKDGIPLQRTPAITIFRAIQDELKPLPLRNGDFVNVFPASRSPWAPPLSADQRSRLLKAAASVGRIETRGVVSTALNGTGFVIAPGIVATNCHVLRGIAAQTDGGTWVLRPGTLDVDFSDGASHDARKEYRIQGIEAYPTMQFLDVAFLRVAQVSNDGGEALPPPLKLARARIQRQWKTEQLPIDVIGYPDLVNLVGDDLTKRMFRSIRESGNSGKLLSPGAVTGVDSHGTLDFLNHIASTHSGESGSPVIDRTTGTVVGIHYCCASSDVPQSISPLACSSQLLSDRDNNEALSSWTVAADAKLGVFLKGDPAAGRGAAGVSRIFRRPSS